MFLTDGLFLLYHYLFIVITAYTAAMYSMARLNKTGAHLMHKYGNIVSTSNNNNDYDNVIITIRSTWRN